MFRVGDRSPGDVQGLVEAIRQGPSDPVCGQAMGAAAKRPVATEFGALEQVDEHLALYHSLLGGSLVMMGDRKGGADAWIGRSRRPEWL